MKKTVDTISASRQRKAKRHPLGVDGGAFPPFPPAASARPSAATSGLSWP